MSPRLLVRARGLFPHTIRFRLSVLYAALFLVAGTGLLGLTYGLVASTLPSTTSPSKFTNAQVAKLELACKQAEQAASSKGQVAPSPVPNACAKLETESANAATANQRTRTLHDLLLFSLLGLGVMTIASGGFGWLMAGRALRPVSQITDAARRASDRHLGERLGMQGPRDELKELADTFDEMLERLDVAFASQKRFVADASHELRTPLTVMRTAIDITLAKPDRSKEQLELMAAKVRRSVDQAERLIESLLTLSVSERQLPEREVVDLATAAEDAIDGVAADVGALDLRVTTHLEPAQVLGDRSLVERLVGNLVDNAVRHNIQGGHIEVRTGSNGNRAYVQVSNSGKRIDNEIVQSLFEPFRRLERITTTAGSGLGLAIVRSIAIAHGGNVDARSLLEGGLEIAVHLPRTPAS